MVFGLLTYHRFQCYLLPVFHKSAFQVIFGNQSWYRSKHINSLLVVDGLKELEWGLGTNLSGLLSVLSLFISVLFPFLCWCWNNNIIIHFQQVNPTFDVPDTLTPDPIVIEIRPSSSISTPVSCFEKKKKGRI